jgi:hypothetical protein
MTFSLILLDNTTFLETLPTALALCIIPLILGWLAATVFHKVSWLKTTIRDLTTDNTMLTDKVNRLTSDNTDLKVTITQRDAEINDKIDQVKKLKNDLIICESDLNALKSEKK